MYIQKAKTIFNASQRFLKMLKKKEKKCRINFPFFPKLNLSNFELSFILQSDFECRNNWSFYSFISIYLSMYVWCTGGGGGGGTEELKPEQ